MVPRTLEEAPLRRMDRRALNALRKRRADKESPDKYCRILSERFSLQHMIGFLVFLSVLFTGAGCAGLVVCREFRAQYKFVGLFIISKFSAAKTF